MKRLAVLVVVGLFASARVSEARPGEHALRGALVGTALGFLVGHGTDAVDTGVAVPVFGLMGAAIGHEMDREAEWRAFRDVEREVAGYGRRWVAPKPAPVPARPSMAVPPAAVSGHDRHPGVELIKISIVDDRGVDRNISILRLGGRFVGPRGESYDALPTEKVLTERYGKTKQEK